MKISALDEYGLRCMVQLARTGPLTISEIAEREGLSPAYIGKLLGQLKQSGLVQSVRGRSGGYSLGEAPADISVARVLRTLGGATWESHGCDRFNGVHETCVHSTGCSVKTLWGALDELVEQILGNVSLADVVAGGCFSAEGLIRIARRKSATGEIDPAREVVTAGAGDPTESGTWEV